MADKQKQLLLMDSDTGVQHIITVEVCEHSPSEVRLTFGNSFSIQLPWFDMEGLAETIHQTSETAANNDRPNYPRGMRGPG